MEKQVLHAQLTQLHQELTALDSVDESTKEMLATVMQDIVKLLQGQQPADPSAPAPTSDSVRAMMADFEAEHPTIAQTLGQVADALQNLGI